ncbi:MAG: polyketide synthase dehydratase domain-containing protein, partial [Rhodobacteraceae bacterium]|nr:polyketide synthase dehydratase domain-containing protein [Paracoccaceae bacterium]
LSVQAGKTYVGHTEPAAGVVGLIHAIHGTCHRTTSPVLHLRHVNPHLTRILGGSQQSRQIARLGHMCREQNGLTWSDSNSMSTYASGVSAFAFQGTNAHVLLQHVSSTPKLIVSELNLRFSSKIRYWVGPLTHPLMSHVELRNDAGSHIICMASKLERPVLDWICDHQVMGRIVCPGAAYMEMSACVSEVCNGSMGTELASLVSDASIPMPLTLAKPKETQNTLIADCTLSILLDVMDGSIQIRSSSSAQGGSGLHLRAFVGVRVEDHDIDMPFSMSDGTKSASISPEMVRSQCCQSVDNAFMYASLRAVGLQYGPSFQVASRVNVHPDGTRVLGCLSCANSTDESGTCVSPAVLDGCMQLSVGLQEKQSSKGPSSDAKVPAGFSVYCNASRLSSKTTFGIAERGEVESSELGNATISSHYILDIHGSVVSKLHELQAKFLIRKADAQKSLMIVASDDIYKLQWQSAAHVHPRGISNENERPLLHATSGFYPILTSGKGLDVAKQSQGSILADSCISSRLLTFIGLGQCLLFSNTSMALNLLSELGAVNYCSWSSSSMSVNCCHNALQALIRILRNESGSKGLLTIDSDLLSAEISIAEVANHVDPLVRANTVYSCRVLPFKAQYDSSLEWLKLYGSSVMAIAGGLGILGSLVARWG